MPEAVGNWRIKIYTSWKRYKKLIPAFLGVALLITLKYYEIDIPGLSGVVLDWLIGSATVFGVYQVKNEPKPDAIVIDTDVTTI